jgi:hypothetical protein
MVAKNANVYAAEPLATGTCFVAELGTTALTKTDFTSGTALSDTDWTDLGHIGEDGYTETKDVNLEDKRNFGGRVVKVLQTEVTWTYKFVFLESVNSDVLKAVYGENNVDVTPAAGENGAIIEVRKTALKLPHQMWCIDTVDSDQGARYRAFLPDAQIVEIGDVVLVHSDTVMYEVTLRAFEDANGVSIYTWIDDGTGTKTYASGAAAQVANLGVPADSGTEGE